MMARSVYIPSGSEADVFQAAWRNGLPVLLKGPTGCGKTRFVQSMAEALQRPLITVACHEDLTAGDLVGRFLLHGGETRWVDGPLTKAQDQPDTCGMMQIGAAAEKIRGVIFE